MSLHLQEMLPVSNEMRYIAPLFHATTLLKAVGKPLSFPASRTWASRGVHCDTTYQPLAHSHTILSA